MTKLLDAINDGTDGETQSTSSAILINFWQVSKSIKNNGLIAGIVASHVALATVYTHFLQRNN